MPAPTPPPVSSIFADLPGFVELPDDFIGPPSPFDFTSGDAAAMQGGAAGVSQPMNWWVVAIVALGAFMILKGR